MRKGATRLSWAALGAAANKTAMEVRLVAAAAIPNDMAGVPSLEEVRERGNSSRGFRGYENNALVAAVRGTRS